MKITCREKIEDCFDGSSVFEFFFEECWRRESIIALRILGEVDYFPDFPRPFFRVKKKGGLQIKGVEGERSCRVIFPSKNKEEIWMNVEKVFERI